MLRPAVAEAWRGLNVPLEAWVRHFYLDIKGLVTIGMGNLCDPLALALKLPLRKPDGSLATPEEIAAEWRTLKAQGGVKDGKPWGLAARHYKYAGLVTQLRLRDEDIDALCAAKLASNATELVKWFPRFAEWPADAQLAVSSMAWAMGPAFARKFPTFTGLVNKGDFRAAGTRSPSFPGQPEEDWRAPCDINATGNPGVIPRNRLNREHLVAAGSELARLYPEVLHGPCALAALDAGWRQAPPITVSPGNP